MTKCIDVRTVLICFIRFEKGVRSSGLTPSPGDCLGKPSVTSTMIRKAFVMSVHRGQEQEYQRRHSPIWKELEAVLKKQGVHNYSIFLHPSTLQLFGYVEIEDEARWAAIARTPECQRWWGYMSSVMPSNVDGSPVAQDLSEVFHLA